MKIKQVKLDLKTARGKRKLAKLLDDGWEIQGTPIKRGWLQFSPGMTDITLIKR